MDATGAETTRVRPRHLLAGLQAGVLGAIYMIVWLMLGSRLTRRSIWEIPNLLATTFYGTHVYQEQYLRTSWSGVAVILTICGVGGLLWSLVWRDSRPPFLTLFGALFGLAGYFLLFDLMWQRIDPIVPLYAPSRLVQIGFVIWGMTLARSPRYSRAIALASGSAQPAVEISSGEVIR